MIGAGLAGISTAYFLRRSGADVTVVERGPAPARETSYANGGLLTPSLTDPWNAPGVLGDLIRSIGRSDAAMLLRLNQLPHLAGWGVRFLLNSRAEHFQNSYLHNARFARFSLELLAEIRRESGIQFEHSGGGILKLFERQAALESAIRIAHWLKQTGIIHRVLDVEELVALEPALEQSSSRLVGAIHYPQDEVGNARLYCEALCSFLAEYGVSFRFSEQVLGIRTKGGLVEGVNLPGGPLEADAFVLAAGSFTPVLGRMVKLRIPVVPAKGYSITVPVAEGLPRLPVVDDALHAAVVPLGGDRLRVAGTAEFAGFNVAVADKRIANLVGLLQRVYPDLAVEGAALDAWAGLRPMTPDGRPLLGTTPRFENLLLNTGHGALGWTLAAASGKVVAELCLGEAPSWDLEPFSPMRF